MAGCSGRGEQSFKGEPIGIELRDPTIGNASVALLLTPPASAETVVQPFAALTAAALRTCVHDGSAFRMVSLHLLSTDGLLAAAPGDPPANSEVDACMMRELAGKRVEEIKATKHDVILQIVKSTSSK